MVAVTFRINTSADTAGLPTDTGADPAGLGSVELDHTPVECVVCSRQVEMCDVGFDMACPDCLDVFDDSDDTCELLRPAA